MTLHDEIYEQPVILRELVTTQWDHITQIAGKINQYAPAYAFLTARGTSDNAGRYAQYQWGIHNALPIALAAPSLFSLYKQPPKLDHALAVGISQSGQSPDIVSVMVEAAKQGCLSVAIVNNTDSPLARAADHVIDVCAKKELAVAATKSYTAELMAIAMLSAALAQNDAAYSILRKAPVWVEAILELDPIIQRMAERYCYMEQCVILGRGYNYATAFEWSLKLKELCYIASEPYSSADFLHGPVALVDHGYPVMAVIPEGKTREGMMKLLSYLRNERKAEILTISNDPDITRISSSNISLPADLPEWVSPLVSIVPAQLFVYHLTRLKGYDTDAPRDLLKVTETN